MQMEIDKEKFDKLYEEIKSKHNELVREINEALLSGLSDSMIQPLKEKKLQCAAELRLMRHIINGMDGDFLIY